MDGLKYLNTIEHIPYPDKPKIIAPGPVFSLDFLGFEKPDGKLIIQSDVPGGAPTFTLEILARYLQEVKCDSFQLIAFTCQGNRTPTGKRPPWERGKVQAFDELGIGYIIHVYDTPMTSYAGLQTPFGPISWLLTDPNDSKTLLSYQATNQEIPKRLREYAELVSKSLILINAQLPALSAEIAKIAQTSSSAYTVMLIDAYPTYRDEKGECPFEQDIVDFVSTWYPQKGAVLLDVNEREAVAIRRFYSGDPLDNPLTIEEIEESFLYLSERGLLVLGTLGPFGNVVAWKGNLVGTPSFLRTPCEGSFVHRIGKGIDAFIRNFRIGDKYNRARLAYTQMANGVISSCGCGDAGKGRVLGLMLTTALKNGWDGCDFRELLEYVPLESEKFLTECSIEANLGGRYNLDRPSAFSNPPISTEREIKLRKKNMAVFHSVGGLVDYMMKEYGLDKALLLDPPPPKSIREFIKAHREMCVEIHNLEKQR